MSVRQLLLLSGVALALLVVPSAVAAPTVSINSGPPNPTNSTSATFTFSGSVDAVSFECSLDGGGFSGCSSGVSYSVGAGNHSFAVHAVDGASVVGPDATWAWTVDTTGPTLSQPNIVREEDANGIPSAVVSFTPTASDPSGGTVNSCRPSSGSTFGPPLGIPITVTCQMTDSLGNTSSGTFQVTVVDTTPPTFPPPANITQTADGVATKAVTFAPTANDGPTAVAPVCSPASGSQFSVSTAATPIPTTVNCVATDASGNSTSRNFTVTVTDGTPPTITVPSPITVNINNATSAVVSYTATATDAGTALTPVCAPASGSSFPLSPPPTTVTCNATDAAGNAAAPMTFTVTVIDNTPPVVSITGGPAATTNSRSASLDFTTSEGTTTCRLDGGGFSGCSSPATYSGLADGNHTFDVTATDAGGLTATASRTWKVDATAPVLSLPSTRIGEADGPNGAIASFSVSASDAGGALLPSAITCSPGSGQLFPLGTTVVTCRASDTAGNLATGTFNVVIQDTTAPAINAPNVSFTATSANGALKTDPDVVAYLTGVSASDLVSTPILTNNMPDVLPIGATTVVFTAKDAAGNVAKRSVTATVLPLGQKAPPPDLTPPGEVLGAKAKAGDRSVTLSWRPLSKDVTHVIVTQFVVGQARVGRQIYDAAGSTVTAKGLVNGTAYRFLIVAYDKAGNRSKGLILVATPKAEALTSPKQAQRVIKPPLLRWAPSAGAGYYNVQLWRGSAKVLSIWPTATSYQLTAKWTFSGKARKLAAGLYTWYVWPGLGPRADARYGSLLGSRTFFYVAAKPKPKK